MPHAPQLISGRRLPDDEVDEAHLRRSRIQMLDYLATKDGLRSASHYLTQPDHPMFKGKHLHEFRYPLMRASAIYEDAHFVNCVLPAICNVFLEHHFVQHDTSQTLMSVLGLDPDFCVVWVFVGKNRAGEDYGFPDLDHVIGLVRHLLQVAFVDPKTGADNVVPVSFTSETVDCRTTAAQTPTDHTTADIRFVVGEDDCMDVLVEFLPFRRRHIPSFCQVFGESFYRNQTIFRNLTSTPNLFPRTSTCHLRDGSTAVGGTAFAQVLPRHLSLHGLNTLIPCDGLGCRPTHPARLTLFFCSFFCSWS